jgi:hypothetical protein
MMFSVQENGSLEDSPGVTSDEVRQELKQILASRHFWTSKRSQQFLKYVVEQKLKGNEGLIKERRSLGSKFSGGISTT